MNAAASIQDCALQLLIMRWFPGLRVLASVGDQSAFLLCPVLGTSCRVANARSWDKPAVIRPPPPPCYNALILAWELK